MVKTLLIIWTAAIFALSLPPFGAAQAPKPAAEKPAEGAKADSKEEAQPVSLKPHIWRAGGLLTAVNPQAKSLSLRQETVRHQRTLTLKVSEGVAKELSKFKAGDLVDVWITGDVVTTLKKLDG